MLEEDERESLNFYFIYLVGYMVMAANFHVKRKYERLEKEKGD